MIITLPFGPKLLIPGTIIPLANDTLPLAQKLVVWNAVLLVVIISIPAGTACVAELLATKLLSIFGAMRGHLPPVGNTAILPVPGFLVVNPINSILPI